MSTDISWLLWKRMKEINWTLRITYIARALGQRTYTRTLYKIYSFVSFSVFDSFLFSLLREIKKRNTDKAPVLWTNGINKQISEIHLLKRRQHSHTLSNWARSNSILLIWWYFKYRLSIFFNTHICCCCFTFLVSFFFTFRFPFHSVCFAHICFTNLSVRKTVWFICKDH